MAAAWGAEFQDYGDRGHINADSGLGDWPEGHQWLRQLQAEAAASSPSTPTDDKDIAHGN